MEIIFKKVPNYRGGREGRNIEAIVIHIGEGNQNQIFGKAKKVDDKSFGAFLYEEKSSHYSVDENGTIWQFVKEEDTAWHAGIVIKPTSHLVQIKSGINPNLWTIGIEHAGWGTKDITDAQYKITGELVEDICNRYNIFIDREHIIGHKEIRNDKTCPGKIDLDKIIRYAQQIRREKETPEEKIEEIKIIEKQLSIIGRIIELLKKINLFKTMENRKYGAFSSSVDSQKLALSIKGLIVFIPSIIALSQLWGVDINADDLTSILLTASLAISQAGAALGTGLTLWGLVRKLLVKLQIL